MSNLFGKVFVLAIMIMSIMFMALAMAVYSTHTNWKDTAERLTTDLQTAQATNSQLTEQSERLRNELDAAESAHTEQLAKLENELDNWVELRDEMQFELREKTLLVSTLSGSVDSTQQNLSRLVAEVEVLREQVRLAQTDRDEKFSQAVAMTDDLGQAVGELERSEERLAQLIQQIATFKQVADAHGVDLTAPADGLAPTVDGSVTAVRKNDLIELSIGSDDGLRQGHFVHVTRGRTYLGRAEVLESAPDRSVGKLLKQYKKGQVKKGDRVATRL